MAKSGSKRNASKAAEHTRRTPAAKRRRARRAKSADVTPELTGLEGNAAEAEIGNAGDGASIWGADRTGFVSSYEEDEFLEPLEAEPADPNDIQPDHLEEPGPIELKDDLERIAREEELAKIQDPIEAVEEEGKPRIERVKPLPVYGRSSRGK
jgi:hypothetical protein